MHTQEDEENDKRKKIIGFGVVVAILVAVGLAGFGGSTAYAHGGGHSNGCKGFGQHVANDLATIPFGHVLRNVAKSGPGMVAHMLETEGHDAMCG